jgi:outer membrane protein assembly factor BamB
MAKKGPDWLDDEDLFDDDDGSAGDIFGEDEVAKNAPVLSRKGGGGSKKRDDVDDDRRPAARSEEPKSKTARIGMRSQKRPGEQEVMKSPLVIGLFAGGIILTIMSGAYWFIIGRDTTEKVKRAILDDLDNQRYSPAIKSLEDFVISSHGDPEIEKYRFMLSKARIDKEITGSRTNWEKGIEMIDLFKKDNRDIEAYDEQKPMLADFAYNITKGAIETARKQPKNGREFIKISESAEARLVEYTDPDSPPKKKQDEIKKLRDLAIDVIQRYEDLQAVYAEIDAFLKNKQPLEALKARRRLLAIHADAENLKDVRTRLEDTLLLEQSLVVKADVNVKPSTEDRPLPVPAPLALTLHTRTSTTEQRGDTTVFALAHGTIYGIETITGDPIWRRPIGFDSPFFPQSVDTTIPGLLAFDTTYNELILLNRLTGELAWRLPLPEPVDGEPLIHEGQIYLPTLGNHLYKIDLQSGAAARRLKFSQPVHSPPVLTRDKEHLLIAGDEAVVYSLTIRPLECVRVSYTQQNPGTIDVPLMKLGKMLLMIENRNAGKAILRAFRAENPAEGITIAGNATIDSHVINRPVLRGNKLFVAGDKEQLNVFTVSDDIDQPPLAPLANPPGIADYSYDAQVHLLTGSDDRLWTASDRLRAFRLEQDALKEKADPLPIGASGQPIQVIGTTLYVGKHLLASDAIGLIEVDGDEKELPSTWSTIVGCGILAMMPTNTGGILFVNKSGHMFSISENDVKGDEKFRYQAESTLGISDSLKDPLRATVLPNNRIAISRGGEKPRIWIVNQAGKVAEEFPLEAVPVGDPVPMAGGAIAVLPNKLRLVGISGGGFVKEYVGIVRNNDETQWASVTPLDQNHAIVINREGELTKLQYRTSPSKHLQPSESFSLQTSIDLPPVVTASNVFVALPDGTLHMLKVVGFEKEHNFKLSRPAIVPMLIAGNYLLVQTSDQQLQCFDTTKKLEKVWSLDMGDDVVSGKPLIDGDNVIITTMNGAVKVIDQAGKVIGSIQLDAPIEHGPLRLGSLLIAVSVDGSLYQVQSVLGGN